MFEWRLSKSALESQTEADRRREGKDDVAVIYFLRGQTENGEKMIPASVVVCRHLFSHIIHSAPLWGSCRMTLAIICFLGIINTYAQRINLSVAIVCMVNQTALQEDQEFRYRGTRLSCPCSFPF